VCVREARGVTIYVRNVVEDNSRLRRASAHHKAGSLVNDFVCESPPWMPPDCPCDCDERDDQQEAHHQRSSPRLTEDTNSQYDGHDSSGDRADEPKFESSGSFIR
jgi:hypothetical protein